MEKVGCRAQRSVFLGMVVQFFFLLIDCRYDHNGIIKGKSTSQELKHPQFHLHMQDNQVVMDNGLVNVTLSIPDGLVTGISYQGIELLETLNEDDNRGYWDLVWNTPGSPTRIDKLLGTSFKVIMQNQNQAELSYTRTWTLGDSKVPLNIDKRFVMLSGSTGFYTYTVLERLKGWPDFDIQQERIVLKLQQNKFHYMAMSEERQRIMPIPVDRLKGQVLDYPEAVLLTNPTNQDLEGEVDDKYLCSSYNKDNRVHGWICTDPPVGLWMISPTNEFRTGGPTKQDLTSHVGPTTLYMFISTHYAGEDLAVKFRNGEPWKKVFGPVFVYLNSNISALDDPFILWDDAKERMLKETASWPYMRGNIGGQLLVHDGYISKEPLPASSAYVGLAPPGKAGSWQRESKGYQFWTQADTNGNFFINGVISGNYNLYAWVPGSIGDYKYAAKITISPGCDIKVGRLVYEAPRNGDTLWEIGVPDRTAAEFYVPSPSPFIKSHSYKNQVDKFREYGLWARYTDLYPLKDLVYIVGESNYNTDWFFAHVTRCMGNHTCQATTWQILFDLKSVNVAGNYTLRLALASANDAELQVRVNNPRVEPPDFTTGLVGKENAIARRGIGGLYWLFNIGVDGTQLVNGRNTIFLTQSRSIGPFTGIMYDYLRLEAPL